MTAAQVSLAWLLAKYDKIVPIPGTTKQSHLEENLRSAEFELSSADIAELDKIADETPIVGDRYGSEQAAFVGK